MAGKPSSANDEARKAFEKSGGKMKVAEMAQKFKLDPSTIYRSPWFIAAKQAKGAKS